MILRSLDLSNLKCFSALRVGLSPLTLFTGFNAAGKSTALHSLILLTQGLRLDPSSEHLPLNGPLIRLGSPEDVFLDDSNKAKISVADAEEEISWHFDMQNAFQVERVMHRTPSGESREWDKMLWKPDGAVAPNSLIDSIRDVIFLGAARGGTPEVYPSPDAVKNVVNADVGNEGQFAPWWYAQMADEEIDEARLHPDETVPSLRQQLDAYFGELFPPNAGADAGEIQRTSLVRIGFYTGMPRVDRRPANIGYGLTYAFPILVALLLARREQVVIIESPEANLHPRAQSKMGGILARFAAAGVQVLVESHSDHVLNGIRMAVKKQVIPHSDVAIHFFGGVDSEGNHGVISPSVDSKGTVDNWPEGFFDQGESDLAVLAGWKEDT
ncbi:MAG: DUF3696 domain-containing protein [Deltaproteobacteria bacterium]|nr:DUF3696 domain-containing protein [Deltaproteobacteria bacterium]